MLFLRANDLSECDRVGGFLLSVGVLVLAALLAAFAFQTPAYAASQSSLKAGALYSLQVGASEASQSDSILAPTKPRISLSASRAGTVAVKVDKVAQADGYEYCVSVSRKFGKDAKHKVTKANSHCFVGSITPTRWFAKVRAYNDVNGARKWGPWSSVKTVVTKRLTLAVLGSTSSEAGGWMRNNGCHMVRIRSSKINVKKYDGLVIPGGDDVTPALYGAKRHPRTYGCDIKFDKLEISVIKKFVKAGKPVLGICRGNQILNVALGGTLFQHIPGWHKHGRSVKIKKGSWLYDTFGASESVSHYHHQCVLKLGKGLKATQWDARDKHIEAVEHETLPIYGLQWHPEGMGSRGGKVARKFMWVCAADNRDAFYGK